MTKDDVGIVTEIEREIDQYAGEEIKKKIMEGSEQVNDLSAEEMAHWLKNVMEKLDTLVNEKTKIQIMENCGVNCAEINKSHIEKALKKREKYKTLDEFLKAEEKTPAKGTRLVKDGDTIYQYYDPSVFNTRCFCSVWRGLKEDETASLTWCHCSKGFVMKVWEAYLGRPVPVELVNSCISGAKECTFVIHL